MAQEQHLKKLLGLTLEPAQQLLWKVATPKCKRILTCSLQTLSAMTKAFVIA